MQTALVYNRAKRLNEKGGRYVKIFKPTDAA